ncbi:MAG: hypothetical protein ACLTTD_17315 [Oscillospiraceae bacterium]|jgi:hypothetical protein
MSKRLVVTPNIEEVNSLVEGKGWSKAYFSETVMKKSRGWITEWKRAKNFPSPEEAARMCAMLQTTPEEILTEQADIELVRGLLEQEREKGIKKERPADGEALIRDLPEDIQQIIRICMNRPELASALLNLAKQIEKD